MEMNDLYGETSSYNGINNGGNCHQYCLKWNNHKLNISGVFDRLRTGQQFCDLTLSSADKRTVKCHKILLCAGSGYLEEILTENPSEHPTIVLSQINYEELKHLVDFMYSGEVAVETDKLGKLLEAARILKIKGLWESGLDETDDNTGLDDDISTNHTEQSASIDERVHGKLSAGIQSTKSISDTTLDILKLNQLNAPLNIPSVPAIFGSQKRKRKSNQQPKINSDFNKNNSLLDQLNQGNAELIASNNKIPRLPSPAPSTSSTHSSASSPSSSILSPSSLSAKSPPNLILPKSPISLSSSNVVDIAKSVQQYGPMFGVSNAYFLTQPPPLNMIIDSNSTGGSIRSSKSSDISSPSTTSAEDISNKLAGLTTPLPPKTIDKLLKDIPKLLTQTPFSSSSPTLIPSSITSVISSNAISPLLPGMIIPSNGNGIVPQKNAVDNIITPSKTTNAKSNGMPKKESCVATISKTLSPSLPGLMLMNTNPQPPTTGEVLANGLQLSVAPVRRYKQYTEETLQQALREIMEGQSINRSSMKYNIPARTLRDWMKRLNIKSVFTHNHSNASPSSSSNQNQNGTSSTSLSVADTSTILTKTSLSVTSVQAVEPTFAIKDMTKLKSANTSEQRGGVALTPKNSFGKEDEMGSLEIKVEDEGDNDVDIKRKQENELMAHLVNKSPIPHTLVSSTTTMNGNNRITTTSTQQQGNLVITDSLISKTNMNLNKNIEMSAENDEDDEEEEIDDDEEAL